MLSSTTPRRTLSSRETTGQPDARVCGERARRHLRLGPRRGGGRNPQRDSSHHDAEPVETVRGHPPTVASKGIEPPPSTLAVAVGPVRTRSGYYPTWRSGGLDRPRTIPPPWEVGGSNRIAVISPVLEGAVEAPSAISPRRELTARAARCDREGGGRAQRGADGLAGEAPFVGVPLSASGASAPSERAATR